MSEHPDSPAPVIPNRPNRYGWVVVAACALMIFVTYGLIYSYSVFFKPLAAHFHWDRSSVSMIYALAVIIRGAASIGIGWLADRYSARWVMVFCGLMMAAGYLLSSQVTELWQFFLTYAVIEAIGMSGTWGICTAVPSRWFAKNRGTILGLVVAGSGAGTLVIIPLCERIVTAYNWSNAFVVCGIASGVLMIIGALFLRNPPDNLASGTLRTDIGPAKAPDGVSTREGLKDPRLWLITAAFFFFFFGSQIIMIHLVNFATDVGVSALVAATFMSVIGAVSVFSRIGVGMATEKVGLYRILVITCLALAVVFAALIFTRQVWAFYLLAVLFGIPYGGEVTLIPLVIARFFGTRAMATLMGFSIFFTGAGGALGSWYAGWTFDMTDSYTIAFITGAAACIASVVMVGILKKQDKVKNT
jgi:MFS family permease